MTSTKRWCSWKREGKLKIKKHVAAEKWWERFGFGFDFGRVRLWCHMQIKIQRFVFSVFFFFFNFYFQAFWKLMVTNITSALSSKGHNHHLLLSSNLLYLYTFNALLAQNGIAPTFWLWIISYQWLIARHVLVLD